MTFAFVAACSRSPTINLRARTFGENPKNVIWIQIPGFELEHVAMLRFGLSDSRKPVALEDVECVGSAWSYNFYDIRTNSVDSTLAQISGSADIKNSCPSEGRFPVWQYYRSLGYSTMALENGVKADSSLMVHDQCNNKTFLDGLTLLQMRQADKKRSEKPFFHYQTQKILTAGEKYFDQTCQGKNSDCFASLSNNVQTMWDGIGVQTKGTFFLVRDFSYINHLKKGDIKKAREALSEINKVVAYFKEQENAEQNLILITGGETLALQLPSRGKEWEAFEKLGKNVKIERTRLLSPVLAKGPSAENFCGVYEESRILSRHFWRQDRGNPAMDKIIELMK